MRTIRRIPSQKEVSDMRFNRRIERIQAVCHALAIVFAMAGLAQLIYGVCLIDLANMVEGYLPAIEGIAALGVGALLANM